MLIYLYLATLIFGGVLLGASILLGGHDDIDADGDIELEADTDGIDKDISVDGATDLFFWLRSIRFWTFFSAFFGMTGLALQSLGLLGPIARLVCALVVGSVSGFSASYAIRKLAENNAGRGTESADYVGKSARVMVPVKPGGVGKVRVEIGGRHVELLATTDDETPLTAEDDVLVVDIEGMRARVARVGP